MTNVRLRVRDKFWAQIAIVVSAAVAFVLLTDALAFRSLANIGWMVGLPILIALVGNTNWSRRYTMMIALVLVSVVVSTLVGVNFTSYN